MKKFEKESCKVPASFLAEEVHAMYPIGTRLDVKENPANATFNGLVVGYYLNYLVVEDQEARRWNCLPTEIVGYPFEVCDYCGQCCHTNGGQGCDEYNAGGFNDVEQ